LYPIHWVSFFFKFQISCFQTNDFFSSIFGQNLETNSKSLGESERELFDLQRVSGYIRMLFLLQELKTHFYSSLRSSRSYLSFSFKVLVKPLGSRKVPTDNWVPRRKSHNMTRTTTVTKVLIPFAWNKKVNPSTTLHKLNLTSQWETGL